MSDKPKWTSGPWHAIKCGDGPAEHYNIDGRTHDGEMLTLAVVQHDSMEWDEFEANAARIVQCVNSHDALVEALRRVVKWDTEHPVSYVEFEEIRKQAEAALAAAQERP